MKKIITLSVLATLLSCTSSHHKIFEVVPQEVKMQTVGANEISAGLKEALTKGVQKEVTKLSNHNGFLKNDLVKIGLPSSLTKFNEAFKTIGQAKVIEKCVELLNHTAEDATKDAKPILLNAIKGISFSDPKSILTGSQNATTSYLENKTKTDLYDKFLPIVKASFTKVDSGTHWEKMITQYNNLPFVKEKVNPDLADYVTNEVVKGVFVMIAE